MTLMRNIEISIILPVHNEAENIRSFCNKLIHVLQKAPFTYELIFVENGSTDESLSILKAISEHHTDVNIVQSEKGWGNAVRRGLKEAKGTLFCYMVTDGQIDPSYIHTLYSLYKKNTVDLVKIRRTKRENTQRLVVSRLYNFFARFLFGFTSRDINATPKILSVKRARALHLESPNIALDAELLLKLYASGGTWVELDAPGAKRFGGASTTNIAAAFEMIASLVRFRCDTIKQFRT